MLACDASGQISEEDDHAEYVKEEDDPLKQQHALKGHEDIIPEATSHFPSPFHINDESLSHDTGQPPVTLHIVKVETASDVSSGDS